MTIRGIFIAVLFRKMVGKRFTASCWIRKISWIQVPFFLQQRVSNSYLSSMEMLVELEPHQTELAA